MLGGQPIVGNFAFLLNCGSGLRFYEGSDLKTYLLMRGLGSDIVSVVGPNGV